MDGVVFDGWRPGAIARTLTLHMDYYAPSWGFGRQFESKLAFEMGEFHGRFDPARDLFLGAYAADGELVATLTVDGIDAAGEGAQFLSARGYGRAYLTTFAGLDAARALYDRHGYVLVAEEQADPWSGTVGLQRFERRR